MKWLGIGVALLAANGCVLEIVQGTDYSQRPGTTSTGSASSSAPASGTTTGQAVNGASSSGGSSGGSSSGNSATGGTAAGGTTGGNGTSGTSGGGTTTGSNPMCDAGLTYCTDSSPLSGVSAGCFDTSSDDLNCGTCDNACATSYGSGSSCRFSLCSCDEPVQQLCAEIPAASPPSCDCVPVMPACTSPSFARDVYPFLAQQAGAFGCAASGCHSGTMPAADLGFLDPTGELDAGMAYAELVGSGPVYAGVCSCNFEPDCDAGVPASDPAFVCPCISRVTPGNIYASYLIDALANDLPATCQTRLPMPTDGTNWLALPPCSLQLVEQWVATGAAE